MVGDLVQDSPVGRGCNGKVEGVIAERRQHVTHVSADDVLGTEPRFCVRHFPLKAESSEIGPRRHQLNADAPAMPYRARLQCRPYAEEGIEYVAALLCEEAYEATDVLEGERCWMKALDLGMRMLRSESLLKPNGLRFSDPLASREVIEVITRRNRRSGFFGVRAVTVEAQRRIWLTALAHLGLENTKVLMGFHAGTPVNR